MSAAGPPQGARPPEGGSEVAQESSDSSPAAARQRPVEIVVYLLLVAFALVLGYDNWRSGMGWEKDGPQSGYLPFYLSLILAAAALYGLVDVMRDRGEGDKAFVTRDQLGRVTQVFVPTLLFCLLTQWIGIYCASFLLVAGFMRFIGRIAWWKSLLTGLLFALAMFATFEIAFDVIMPKGPLEALFGF